MAFTLLLMQIANFALAGVSAWLYYWNLNHLGGQAVIYSAGTGFVITCATLLILGLNLLVTPAVRWLGFLLHFILALTFFGFQGYLFYFVGNQLGLFSFLPF